MINKLNSTDLNYFIIKSFIVLLNIEIFLNFFINFKLISIFLFTFILLMHFIINIYLIRLKTL